ncbi:hypothetical protein BHE74_00052639 [Ensete ventricosum]|nr:hypothetical protein BHE74_00052639 [Ensete ventricosum]RZR97577.1 hypothetical protein BHM03_00026796 [Ensete ventricosum]
MSETSIAMSPASPRTLESKSNPTGEIRKNTTLTSVAMSPSSSLFNSATSGAKENMGSDVVTHISNSSVKSFSFPKMTPNVQMEAPNSVATSIKFPSGTSPPKSTSMEAKTQVEKQLNLKTLGEGFSGKLQGSMQQSAVSSESSSALSTNSNALSFSTMFGASASNLGVRTDISQSITDRKQSSGTVSSLTSDTKVSSSPSPFSTFTLSTPSSTSNASTSAMPSLPSIKLGGPSPVHAMASVSGSTSSTAQYFVQSSSASASQSQSSSSTSALSPSKSSALQSSPSVSNEARARSELTLQQTSSPQQGTLKFEPVTSQEAINVGSTGLSMRGEPSSVLPGGSIIPAASNSQLGLGSVVSPPMDTTAVHNNGLDVNSSQEEEMEEEASDASNMLNLGALGGFGLGSESTSSTPKPNPFGGSFVTANTSTSSSPVMLTASPGQLFRPPSLSLPTAQSLQPSQSINSSAFSGGNTSGLGGFGQPSQIGAGQQALGSVLGAFGQSRQLGAGGFGGGFPTVATSGGFSSATGLTGTAAGGGFAALASRGGGFAAAAAASSSSGFAGIGAGGFAAVAPGGVGSFGGAGTGGGFGASASSSGGFAGAGSGGGFSGGGFAGAASQGGGFGAAGFGGGFTSGGFGAFSSNQGGAFSAFGGSSAAGTGRPPSDLFTQMRR